MEFECEPETVHRIADAMLRLMESEFPDVPVGFNVRLTMLANQRESSESEPVV